MDATAYPHLLASISRFAASHYTSGHDRTTALALRATCRTLRDIVDRRLFEHVAYKDGQFFTPKMHRLPSMYPTGFSLVAHAVALAESRNLCACCQRRAGITWDEARGLVHMLDLYSELPGGEVFAFPRLETVRCAEACWVAPPAQTVLARIHAPTGWRTLKIQDGARRCALRWHPIPEDEHVALEIPPSLGELVVFFRVMDWRGALHRLGPEQRLLTLSCADYMPEATIAGRAMRYILKDYLYDLVERGGRVTFLVSEGSQPNPRWQFFVDCGVEQMLHHCIARNKYGWSGDSIGTEGSHIAFTAEDKKLKDNVKVMTFEEWSSAAGDLELEWLDRNGV